MGKTVRTSRRGEQNRLRQIEMVFDHRAVQARKVRLAEIATSGRGEPRGGHADRPCLVLDVGDHAHHGHHVVYRLFVATFPDYLRSTDGWP